MGTCFMYMCAPTLHIPPPTFLWSDYLHIFTGAQKCGKAVAEAKYFYSKHKNLADFYANGGREDVKTPPLGRQFVIF
jgi:hypothetical protein